MSRDANLIVLHCQTLFKIPICYSKSTLVFIYLLFNRTEGTSYNTK